MVGVDLGFCPRCGNELVDCEPPERNRSCCSVCGEIVYNNPFPVVVATVVDGDSALFVKRARAPDKGCWSMPGGYLEVDEPPQVGAARELAEETGLEAAPEDLTFVGTDYEPLENHTAVVDIVFAVPRTKVEGELVPHDDADDARFWSREEIAEDPPQLRAGNVTPVLWAIDTIGKTGDAPLW